MEEYLNSFRDGHYDTVYYLSKLGRDMIGSKKQVKRTLQTKHTLMRNDFFFYIGCPSKWTNEVKVTDGETNLVTDALFTKSNKHQFLEVDNTQTMTENSLKIRKYREMFDRGLFQKEFGYYPTLHIVTVNKSRVRKFNDMCEGLPVQVYLHDDIK